MICCKECIDLLHDYFEGALDQETKNSLEINNLHDLLYNQCSLTLWIFEIHDPITSAENNLPRLISSIFAVFETKYK